MAFSSRFAAASFTVCFCELTVPGCSGRQPTRKPHGVVTDVRGLLTLPQFRATKLDPVATGHLLPLFFDETFH